MTSAGTSPSNRPRILPSIVLAATTSRPPRPGRAYGNQSNGQPWPMAQTCIKDPRRVAPDGGAHEPSSRQTDYGRGGRRSLERPN